MKIYTRTGDDGSTGLFGGSRVRKSDARIECYGTVDELNAVIGLAAMASPALLREMLAVIQGELFVIGAELATPGGRGHPAGMEPLQEASIARLEAEIDSAEAVLPPLRNFILPGGCESAARLHLARTVCRRAERRAVELAMEEPVDPMIVKYVNRLSDWLFVQARWANHTAGVADIPWLREKAKL
jgi:cob(I)alamin adenosyltransferase